MCILFVYINYIYGFRWISLILIIGALLFFEFPAKEAKELVKEQIENLKAGTANLKLAATANRTATEVNIKTLQTLDLMRKRMGA
jgi:hypothetical protein